MRREYLVAAVVVLVFAGSYIGRSLLLARRERNGPAAGAPDHAAEQGRPPQRIVSLAPSITETLYALGLGDRVVGVTRFCSYPPQVQEKQKVGGYYDPNYEAVVDLRPDLVVMLAEHGEAREILSGLGLEVLAVNHKTIPGILDSIPAIGEACGAKAAATAIVGDIQARMDRVQAKTRDLPRPRVLISVDRDMDAGAIKEVYIAGKEGFYDTMIELAGGTNAYEGPVRFPVVAVEGILRMNPEVIIDMAPNLRERGLDPERVVAHWQSASRADAVRNARVYVFAENYEVVPGPRFILTIEKMARALHPDVDWEAP